MPSSIREYLTAVSTYLGIVGTNTDRHTRRTRFDNDNPLLYSSTCCHTKWSTTTKFPSIPVHVYQTHSECRTLVVLFYFYCIVFHRYCTETHTHTHKWQCFATTREAASQAPQRWCVCRSSTKQSTAISALHMVSYRIVSYHRLQAASFAFFHLSFTQIQLRLRLHRCSPRNETRRDGTERHLNPIPFEFNPTPLHSTQLKSKSCRTRWTWCRWSLCRGR